MDSSLSSSSSLPATDDPGESDMRPKPNHVRFNSNSDGTQPPTIELAELTDTEDTKTSTPPRPSPALHSQPRGSTQSLGGMEPVVLSHDFASVGAQSRESDLSGETQHASILSTPASYDSAKPSDEETSYFVFSKERPVDHAKRDAQLQDEITKDDEKFTPGEAAFKLVRGHSRYERQGLQQRDRSKSKPQEFHRGAYDGSYDVAVPEQWRGGVLAQLLKLYKQPTSNPVAAVAAPKAPTPPSKALVGSCPPTPGTSTPGRRKWYEQNDSNETLANLIGASAKLANPSSLQSSLQKSGHGKRLSQLWQQEESRVTIHIAGILARQDFIIKLCRGLMLYGAPTHRLEEYLTMTARILEIEASFIYLPGCMIIAFDDSSTHTTEVKLVRLAQGIDLGRLKDIHRIYKEVLHDVMGVEEATEQLTALMNKRNKFNPWFRVLIFGLTSVTAAPFSFQARLIDLPLCFAFGCLVGFLQLIVAPKSSLYTNVFEVTATLIISFLARAFGSLRGGDLFCFSALAQGGIVMLLPGYMFLSSSLELQARAIVPGSIRTIFGVIYSLLLGFGITIGAALYGFIDKDATSEIACRNPPSSYYGFLFVPPFVLCISILYQAKWRQMPMMVLVAFAGYVVNYFASIKFNSSPQIAGALGAFTVGLLANLDSRIRHSVAAAILIPAIFTQVPGSLSSQGGLLSGLEIANNINHNTGVVNGTVARMDQATAMNGLVFSVASSMIQITIGITVGLFISALIIYPLGKRRSGLFSF